MILILILSAISYYGLAINIHQALVELLSVYIFGPIIIILVITALYANKQNQMLAKRMTSWLIWMVGFTIGLWLTLPTGGLIQSYEVRRVREFPDKLDFALQSYRQFHGKYPSDFNALRNQLVEPRLLREPWGHISITDKGVFYFGYKDPAHMPTLWTYYSDTKTWSEHGD